MDAAPTTASCWSPEQKRGSHCTTFLGWKRLGELRYLGSLFNLLHWFTALHLVERKHFHILGQLQPKTQSHLLSNPKTNPRSYVHLVYTSQAMVVKYSYLMPHNICSKKMNALTVIDIVYCVLGFQGHFWWLVLKEFVFYLIFNFILLAKKLNCLLWKYQYDLKEVTWVNKPRCLLLIWKFVFAAVGFTLNEIIRKLKTHISELNKTIMDFNN